MDTGPRARVEDEEPGVEAPSADVLKIMCWNINCLAPTVRDMELRHKSFRGFLDHFAVDIACFQEVKLPAARITRELACVEGFQSFWATSTSKPGYSGVTTWCRGATAAPRDAAADCLGGDEQPELDTEGRLVMTDHGAFVLLNVYVPNAGDRPERPRLAYKLAFLRALRAKMDELTAAGRLVVLVGDLNIAAERRDVHPALDWPGMYDERELAVLGGLLAAYPDVWRRLHGDVEGSYTVWEERTSARAFNVGLRIDYVLVSPGLLPYIEACEILTAAELPPKWSDHAALLLTLRVRAVVVPNGTQLGSLPAEEAAAAAAPAVEIPAPAAAAGVQDAVVQSADAGGGAAPPRLQLPPPPAAPCALWRDLEARFVDRNQKSIRDIFGRKGPSGGRGAAPPATGTAPAVGTAGGAGTGKKRGATEEAVPRPAPALRLPSRQDGSGSGGCGAVQGAETAAAAAAADAEATRLPQHTSDPEAAVRREEGIARQESVGGGAGGGGAGEAANLELQDRSCDVGGHDGMGGSGSGRGSGGVQEGAAVERVTAEGRAESRDAAAVWERKGDEARRGQGGELPTEPSCPREGTGGDADGDAGAHMEAEGGTAAAAASGASAPEQPREEPVVPQRAPSGVGGAGQRQGGGGGPSARRGGAARGRSGGRGAAQAGRGAAGAAAAAAADKQKSIQSFFKSKSQS